MAEEKVATAEAPLQEPPRATPMVPSPPGPGGQGGALAPVGKPKARRGVRGLILPAIILAALGYGGMKGYDWFVEGRFLVTTDDAYVGADMSVITAKVGGHIAQMAVANNTYVHAGDLLVKIDDGDYQLAVAAAKDKIATQDATIA